MFVDLHPHGFLKGIGLYVAVFTDCVSTLVARWHPFQHDKFIEEALASECR